MEFLGVRTIELVRFADLCPTLRFRGLAGGGGGMSEGGDHSRELRQHSVRQVILILIIVAIIVGVTIWGATRGATRRTSRWAGRRASRRAIRRASRGGGLLAV